MINKQIEILINELGIKKVEFARALKIDQSYVTRLISGDNKPSERLIQDICREFKVDHLWLTTGKGEMFLDIPETLLDQIVVQYKLDQEEKEIIKNFLQLTKEQRRTLIDLFKVKNGWGALWKKE